MRFTVDDFGYTIDAESTAYGINDQRYGVDQIDELVAAARCSGGKPGIQVLTDDLHDEGIARAMQDDSYYLQYDHASEDDWLAVNFYVPDHGACDLGTAVVPLLRRLSGGRRGEQRGNGPGASRCALECSPRTHRRNNR